MPPAEPVSLPGPSSAVPMRTANTSGLKSQSAIANSSFATSWRPVSPSNAIAHSSPRPPWGYRPGAKIVYRIQKASGRRVVGAFVEALVVADLLAWCVDGVVEQPPITGQCGAHIHGALFSAWMGADNNGPGRAGRAGRAAA